MTAHQSAARDRLARARALRVSGLAGGVGAFEAPSATHPGETWRVVWAGRDDYLCHCPGFAFRGRCRHCDQVAMAVLGETTAAAARCREIATLFDCE